MSPFGNTFYDYRKGIELSDDQIDLAIKTSNKLGLKVFFSVLDIESYKSIIDFGLTRVKLPSTISRNKELLNYDDSKLTEYYNDLNNYYMDNPERASMQMEIMAECEYSDTSESEYSASDEEYWSD
jgi:hypothetical protein